MLAIRPIPCVREKPNWHLQCWVQAVHNITLLIHPMTKKPNHIWTAVQEDKEFLSHKAQMRLLLTIIVNPVTAIALYHIFVLYYRGITFTKASVPTLEESRRQVSVSRTAQIRVLVHMGENWGMAIETHCYSAFQSTTWILRMTKWQLAGNLNLDYKQECILVGCVPSAAVAVPVFPGVVSAQENLSRGDVCRGVSNQVVDGGVCPWRVSTWGVSD